jgi:hypothetical protein
MIESLEPGSDLRWLGLEAAPRESQGLAAAVPLLRRIAAGAEGAGVHGPREVEQGCCDWHSLRAVVHARAHSRRKMGTVRRICVEGGDCIRRKGLDTRG